jgi:tetratricopeptide (TPR) repeat protein
VNVALDKGDWSSPAFEEVLRAGNLPAEAAHHLRAAGQAFHQDRVAEGHLRDAARLAPDHAAVLIGRYRYFFYKHRLTEALEVARECLRKAARDNGFVADWRQVRREAADFGSYHAILPRFFLFTLKGYAYLQMRLGNLTEGRAAVDKLLELDPSDKVGARVLAGVLERMGRDDDD